MRTITRGRSRGTYVKAKELQPGMVVSIPSAFGSFGGPIDVVVRDVVRAADEVERLREYIGKTKSRPKLVDAVDELKHALDALYNEGREARIVIGHSIEGDRLVRRTYTSQDDLRYQGQRSVR